MMPTERVHGKLGDDVADTEPTYFCTALFFFTEVGRQKRAAPRRFAVIIETRDYIIVLVFECTCP